MFDSGQYSTVGGDSNTVVGSYGGVLSGIGNEVNPLNGADTVFDTSSSGTAGVYLPSGGSMWLAGSDVSLKRNLRPVDEASILDKVSQLPIRRWSYKAQDESKEHIGPTAQDFYATFGVGDNNTSIGTLDPSGVALAAIKELNRENRELKNRVEELAKLVEGLIENQR